MSGVRRKRSSNSKPGEPQASKEDGLTASLVCKGFKLLPQQRLTRLPKPSAKSELAIRTNLVILKSLQFFLTIKTELQ
jgi:hypothetical protein